MTKHELEDRIRTDDRLLALGFSREQVWTLRRISQTLSKWSEHECNGNIQRDGDDGEGLPRWYSQYSIGHDAKPKGSRIPDRERGALKRLAAIMAPFKRRLVAYHQGDPRGCALYIVPKKELRGQDIGSVYNRGIAVC